MTATVKREPHKATKKRKMGEAEGGKESEKRRREKERGKGEGKRKVLVWGGRGNVKGTGEGQTGNVF